MIISQIISPMNCLKGAKRRKAKVILINNHRPKTPKRMQTTYILNQCTLKILMVSVLLYVKRNK